MLYDAALSRAQELDNHLNSTGRVVGPLHGLPISVKDQISIAGSTSTSALITSAGFTSDADAHIVEIFREAGAVFYVKTVVPQGLFVSNYQTCKFHGCPFGLTTLCARLLKWKATCMEEQ